MRKSYIKTDIPTKINLVEEYLRLKSANGTTIREYAEAKGISYTTIRRWIRLYKAGTIEQSTEKNLPEIRPGSGFIMITEESAPPMLEDDLENECPFEGVRLKYKDAVLEFDSSQLAQVMKILRRW